MRTAWSLTDRYSVLCEGIECHIVDFVSRRVKAAEKGYRALNLFLRWSKSILSSVTTYDDVLGCLSFHKGCLRGRAIWNWLLLINKVVCEYASITLNIYRFRPRNLWSHIKLGQRRFYSSQNRFIIICFIQATILDAKIIFELWIIKQYLGSFEWILPALFLKCCYRNMYLLLPTISEVVFDQKDCL